MNTSSDPAALAAGMWESHLCAVAQAVNARGLHPTRVVVLLPYAQLMPVAAACWARRFPSGFLPHFETTNNWAARVSDFSPGDRDLRQDHAHDVLTAQWLLRQNSVGSRVPGAATLLQDAALQLAPCVAGVPPEQRAAWIAQATAVVAPTGMDALDAETVLERLAIAWAGNSAYATDALFDPAVQSRVELLCVLPGLAQDALTDSLVHQFGERVLMLPPMAVIPPEGVRVRACLDAADEAEQAAALVLAQVAAGRTPVGLVALDRVVTRRITALLAARGVVAGVNLRDETGWKLSTTHAAATAAAAVRAGASEASTDEVLDWAKLMPSTPVAELRALEDVLRRGRVQSWRRAERMQPGHPVVRILNDQRRMWPSSSVALAQWLRALRGVLEGAGIWQQFQADSAGVQVIAALGLEATTLAAWEQSGNNAQPMDRTEFLHWLESSLEAARFHPPACTDPAVIVLPLAQVMGRPLKALVMPGADESLLPMAPEPAGRWTSAQRAALGLPTRERLEQEQERAWRHALGVADVDLLWCSTDDHGEPQLPSPRVELLRLEGTLGLDEETVDPRQHCALLPEPVQPPQADGSSLPVEKISASAYESLRRCPYQFFALRQLGLQEDEELDEDPNKRDWGVWVHAVLRDFHVNLQKTPQTDRRILMDQAAERVTHIQGLDEIPGAFLPFASAWPRLRDAYLKWLEAHEAQGYRFDAAEIDVRADEGGLHLIGRMDRQDRAPDGGLFIIDYKTEALQKTRTRVKPGSEDIQLPFYALLAQTRQVQASYLNLAEREAPSLHQVANLLELAELLSRGMRHDFERMRAGAPMQALGQGSVCDWCPARGLCRKDFWS